MRLDSQQGPPFADHHVANISPTATVIAPVHSHPTARRPGGRTNGPITSRRIAMSMMIAISGTATTPLMTADQNSALIGSSPTKLIATPIRVEAAIAP